MPEMIETGNKTYRQTEDKHDRERSRDKEKTR